MRRLLLSLTLAALGWGLRPAPADACWPCAPVPVCVPPVRLEYRTVTNYREEFRTEYRTVQRTVTRQVPETQLQEARETVLVPYTRQETRTRTVLVPRTRLETR